MIASVILAAGSSSRMGTPKALLQVGGKTFLEHIVSAVRAAAIDVPMIAVAQDDRKILELCSLHGMTAVMNTATPTAVPLGSVQAAVTAVINRPVDALLVWPVDQPHVLPSTVSELLSAFLRFGKAITLPVYDGRRGHPVVFGRAVFGELLSAPLSEGARAVVRADPARVTEVPVRDPAIIDDIDTVEAYQDLLRRHAAGALPI